MAKIKKTDISKLSKLEQQIEELKAQKKKQEEDLSKNIGNHILNNIDIDELDSAEDLYEIIDEVLEKFNSNIQNNDHIITHNNISSEDDNTDTEQNEVQDSNY